MKRGIILVGGGAIIKGLDSLISEILKLPVHIAGEPLSAVVRGTGVVLENLDEYKEVLVNYDDDAAPR